MADTLVIDDLTYSYDDKTALAGATITLNKGERIAVLGNNGAGKSTFMLCCNGVLKPQRGTITLNGQAIGKSKRDLSALRQAVGLVFQNPDDQIIASSVETEISFGPMNLGLPDAEVARRVDDAITSMQLDGYRTLAPQYLSGGERKRVTIADILAMEPQIVFFDEPEASLDPYNVALLEQNLAKLHNRGLGLVVSTHDVNFAWRWADRIVVFNDGRIVRDAYPEEVFDDVELLAQCNLEQPILFQVGKRLGMATMPKNIDDIMPL